MDVLRRNALATSKKKRQLYHIARNWDVTRDKSILEDDITNFIYKQKKKKFAIGGSSVVDHAI